MKAMILAAGRGERMRPLTDSCPKPLLSLAGKPLIEHHLERLAAGGFREVVINVSWLGDMIVERLGDGRNWGLDIQWSREAEPLETAGGIVQALPLLGEAPFALVNGDIWTDFPLASLRDVDLADGRRAHLVLVDNPPQHPAGDFALDAEGRVRAHPGTAAPALTYAGIAVYHPAGFADAVPGKQPLLRFLQAWLERGVVSGEHYRGRWYDVGTPARLAELDAHLALL